MMPESKEECVNKDGGRRWRTEINWDLERWRGRAEKISRLNRKLRGHRLKENGS